ncbi:MAG: CvpA family protein [Lachnospiraceae bacterium]
MSEITNLLVEHWLSVGVGVFLVAMMLYGHYRGFIRLAVSVGAMIITLVVVNMAMPKVNDLLKNETVIHEWIGEKMLQSAGLTSDEGVTMVDPSMQISAIEGLNLPQQLKDALIENNNSAVYEVLGVEAFTDYVGRYLADLILNTIGYIVLYLIVYILLRLLVFWLDLVARLPIIYGLNHIAGACLGLVEGLLIVWLGCLILPVFAGSEFGIAAMAQIAGSDWLSFLYNVNIFPQIAIGLLKGFL